MREIQASEAKTHLAKLLDEVEHGETVIITRRGRAIARLVPDEEMRRQERLKAIEEIKELGRRVAERNGKISLEEILSSVHEGHKY